MGVGLEDKKLHTPNTNLHESEQIPTLENTVFFILQKLALESWNLIMDYN